ncbi:hypothetical protein CesoFtcFv8_007740 [Champsocephalus esox]|uniref:Uncharacterized protein n=1 Tax=Champsocephalus esox TaxID=159716 RepID=A0AAN8H4S4_9TELE|nr:hypothetical protein CesoFtcFv8_007740 [Champsocephalus esox]
MMEGNNRKFEELTEMLMLIMQSQTAGEQQFLRIQQQVSEIEEEQRLRRQDGRLAEELDRINVRYGDQAQRGEKVMQQIQEYRMELREQDRRNQQKEEAEQIMGCQLLEELERQRQAELTAQKARKLEKVNRSLQRHLQQSAEEKEERERELLSMKKQIATLMQRLQADPAQLERLQSMLSVKNGGIQDLRRKSLSERQRVLELERKLYSTERLLKQTQSDKIKLQTRVGELQHKYEPKEPKKDRIPKRKKEKLPFDITAPSEETTLHKGPQVLAVGIDITKITNSDVEAANTAETEKLPVEELVRKGYDEDGEGQSHSAAHRGVQETPGGVETHGGKKNGQARERCNHAHRTVVRCLAAVQLCG